MNLSGRGCWLKVWIAVLLAGTWGAACNAQSGMSGKRLAYIGTLDRKLLVFDEDKEAVVDEIPLNGIPRTTALSADQTKLYIINTKMTIEIVDLIAKRVTSTIDLADEKNKPRVTAVARNWLNGSGSMGRFSGLAVDPAGRYLYTTLRVVTKEIDQYKLETPKFVVIDLQEGVISKRFDFPKGYDTGFGFMATYKVSPDGKLLYVFDEDIMVIDLSSFTVVDRIPLAKPSYPGASPYRLSASDDPYDGKTAVSSVYTSVDPIVHKGILGMATLNLLTRKVDYTPIGPALPMIGFMVSPDHKLAYSVMYAGAGGNRTTEWWVWDLQTHQVIKKAPFESRPTFSFGLSSDGKKLYLYGAGSTLEIYDAATLQSEKMIFVNKDLTTKMVTLAYNQ